MIAVVADSAWVVLREGFFTALKMGFEGPTIEPEPRDISVSPSPCCQIYWFSFPPLYVLEILISCDGQMVDVIGIG